MDDLEESIHHHREELALYPIGDPHCASTLRNLGARLNTRFENTGNVADLDESIRHHEAALILCPVGHPGRPSILNTLGYMFGTRSRRTGNMEGLEKSIRYHQEAVTLRPIGHPDRASTLSNLGIRFDTRFGRTGNIADLEESIRLHQEAVTQCPTVHPDRALTLNNLGTGLNKKFWQTGNIGDLDEGIRHYQEAVNMCPIGYSDRASILQNLGAGLNMRFKQTRNMADPEESMRHQKKALILTPIGHSHRALTLNNLGDVVMTRFEQTGNMADLEESIGHQKEALTLRPIGHPYRASTLSNLGNVVMTRFKQTGNMADLEESIGHHKEALVLRPIGHPDRASTLNNLGNVVMTRFEQTGNMADLEESIGHLKEALILCPIGHPDRAAIFSNLGNTLGQQFGLTGNMADLRESAQHHTNAARETLSKLSDRLTGARRWIKAARENGLELLDEAYSAYMDLLDRSLLLSTFSLPDTHSHMVRIRRRGLDVTGGATSYAIKKHRLSEAVEIAERGQALLLTQLDNYRTPLDDLEVVNNGLADRFRVLGTALDHSATSLPGTMTTGDNVGRIEHTRPSNSARTKPLRGLLQRVRWYGVLVFLATTCTKREKNDEERGTPLQRQKIAADWDRTIKEIRQLDGFRDFLSITPFAHLQKAAAGGPVILINISRDDSYGLIIIATQEPLSVPLPDATPDAVVELANTLIKYTREAEGDRRFMEMLRELWALIVAPIVLQLETTLSLPAGSRIWWMPTWHAWWLPLHAAGPYKSGELNLPDRFISSYTTTLSSLIRSCKGYHPIKRVSGPRLLVIAQAKAEGQVSLPNVEAEVTLIRQLPTEVTVVEEEDCTRDVVLAGLKNAAWAHFSCHGHQHPTKPFNSHFSLLSADAPLTLLDIIQNDPPRAELAVLSACHSASSHLSMPSESINLAASIMFAGFRGAVGTMWAMDDRDGPIMFEHFYKYMFRNGPKGVDCRDAAKAMVMGVRELRGRKVPLARWINFIHYGI
ncbi:hypothetical protein FRB93_011343 [Tulasnella sp. JGI-2019a]|nr:hypothetical protein FRB93_011343 [Tulasnella sp. JGI-2019a]